MLNDSPPTKTFNDIGEINQYNFMDMGIKNDVLGIRLLYITSEYIKSIELCP